MTELSTQPDVPTLEIDILLYLGALIRGWRYILLAGLAVGSITSAYCLTLPDTFEAFVRTTIIDSEAPGGIKPDERRASEVLTLVEHGFVMGTGRANYREIMLTRLRSRQFTMTFMDSHNIYRYLNPGQWDATTNDWLPGFKVDKQRAFKRFIEEVRMIEHDIETDLITVRIRWTDQVQAKDWANAYVTAFNDYIRQRALVEVERKRDYLEAELARSDVVEIQKSIYRLIEAQTAISMLANSRDEFALEIIDPATIPFDRFSPAPKRTIALGTLAGTMLACFGIIGTIVLRRFITLLGTLKQDGVPANLENPS